MNFNRIRIIQNPIELTSTSQVDLKTTFKQYDIGTSFLVLNVLFDGMPAQFVDEKVYIVYKSPTNKYNVFVPLLKENGTRIVDVGSYKTKMPGILTIEISQDVLNHSGTIIGELMIVDATGKKRFTGPALIFSIIPSLSENVTAKANMFKCGQLVCGEVVPDNSNQEIEIKSFLNEEFIKNNQKLISEVQNGRNR